MNDPAIAAAVLEYLNHAPTSEFNGLDATMVGDWEGAENLLWRITTQVGSQDAVLKLYLDAGQARSRRQFDGQQLFAPVGIAPRPLWYDRHPQGLARQILVYSWAEGKLADATSLSQVAALAQAVALVHSGDIEAVRRFSPNPLNLETLWRILAGSVPHLQQWLSLHSARNSALFHQLVVSAEEMVKAALPFWQGARPAPVHGDLKLENCLMGATFALLLDWEMFGLGDPALDAASFLYWNRGALSQPASAHWKERYLAETSHIHAVERIEAYEKLLPFQTLCYLLDGLRNMSSQEADAVAYNWQQRDAAFEFLQETLQIGLDEAAYSLDIESIDAPNLVAELFAALATIP